MSTEQYSLLLQKAVDAFSSLPGIGPKSALRLALYLLRQEKEFTHSLVENLLTFVDEIHHCSVCHNISDHEVCSICSAQDRDPHTLCVVESVREVIAFERTQSFAGLYHVIGGLISPMEGIGTDDLFLDDLRTRVIDQEVHEVILALSATPEGDMTAFYIYRQLQDLPIRISMIARGVAVGDEIEYADDVTLGRSIMHRTDFRAAQK